MVNGCGSLKQQYVKDDKLVSGSDVALGTLMLYDEAEWRARTIGARNDIITHNVRSMVFVWLITIILVVTLLLLIDLFDNPDDWFFFLFLISLTTLPFILLIYVIDSYSHADPVPGLYTNGFLLFNRIFVPYYQLLEIEERRINNPIQGRIDMVYLVPKSKRKKSDLTSFLSTSRDFLGEEGVVMLYEVTWGKRSDDGPTKMFV
jgi:hypothetical protein